MTSLELNTAMARAIRQYNQGLLDESGLYHAISQLMDRA